MDKRQKHYNLTKVMELLDIDMGYLDTTGLDIDM